MQRWIISTSKQVISIKLTTNGRLLFLHDLDYNFQNIDIASPACFYSTSRLRKKSKLIVPTEQVSFLAQFRRPDMTFTADWALKTNYLSIYQDGSD